MLRRIEEQHGIGTWIKMKKINKITMEWVAKIKDVFKNDWCETLIFQYIAIETENGFRIKLWKKLIYF